MREQRSIVGAKALLFDRLTDLEPAISTERRPRRILDPAALRESIRIEIARLLNTRRSVAEDRRGGVIDYGMPDFGPTTPVNESHRTKLEANIASVLATHEPRLRNVQVKLICDPKDKLGLIGSIQGTLATEFLSEPVSFPLAIRAGNSVVAVAGASTS